MDDNKLDERILSYFRRRQAMESLTNDERVRAIWSHWDERTPGRIDFIIKARLSWESKRDSEMDVGLGWIRPTPYDPVQAGPAFVLPPSPIHELGAGVPVEDVPEEEHDRASQALGVAAAKASFITDTLAFLTGFPAWWRPARIIKMRHGGEHPREDEYDYRRYWRYPTTTR